MTVNVRNKNGIRYGTFEIHGIKGHFPQQAILSTNLNHVKDCGKPNFDFKTNILEIIEFEPNKLRTDQGYRERQIKKISERIAENPDKLCLLTLRGPRGDFKITKDVNEFIIKFQIKCGFKLIKVFFGYVKNASENHSYFRSLIPKECSFVAVLDENLTHSVFKSLYLECLRRGDEIISFFGREPSKKNSQNSKNQLNFLFITKRKDDMIIRFTSFIPKAIENVASAYVYILFGFDVFSSMIRRGNPNIPQIELKALNGFKYEPLIKSTNLRCVITGQNLYYSSKYFETKIGKSSVPLSIHAIVELNKRLELLQEKYTRKQLEKIVGNRFYH